MRTTITDLNDRQTLISPRSNLREVAKLFLKLGIIGFGGPAAHIAMMRHEVVHKKKWLTEHRFLDLLGATNLIPGPNSTEMAIHIGQERAGWRGLIVAGICFIFPAVLITGIFAWLYKDYGALPQLQPFLYGIKPAIIAIILSAVFPLAKKSFKTIQLAIIGFAAFVLSLLHYNEIFVLFGSGFVALFFYFTVESENKVFKNSIPFLLFQLPKATTVSTTNFNIFLIFLKIGAILYGSGYVLFAFLDAELVAKGLLSRTQLIDAIAVGQFTPGPVFSAVTFIGYQMDGWTGAIMATIGIFLPSFFFVALLNPLVKKMRNSKPFGVFLDAVNVASNAIIASVCLQLGQETIVDWRTIVIAITSLFFTFKYKNVNSAFIVVGGSLLGYFLYNVGGI